MTPRARYTPGPAAGARVEKDGETWTLVIVRELRHAPALVWQALTDPAHLKAWAPFDADRNLGQVGATVTLSTVGTPAPQVAETTITRAESPRLLEYQWGRNNLRWELEPQGTGTRLTLWHNIERGFIAWGAAGWHLCLDVLDHALAGDPLGRMVGPALTQDEGWQRLAAEYSAQFGVQPPSWGGKS